MSDEETKAAHIAEARLLLSTATHHAGGGEPERAVWRAVEAAGLLATALGLWHEEGVVGVTMPTGRGFSVAQGVPTVSVVRRLK